MYYVPKPAFRDRSRRYISGQKRPLSQGDPHTIAWKWWKDPHSGRAIRRQGHSKLEAFCSREGYLSAQIRRPSNWQTFKYLPNSNSFNLFQWPPRRSHGHFTRAEARHHTSSYSHWHHLSPSTQPRTLSRDDTSRYTKITKLLKYL